MGKIDSLFIAILVSERNDKFLDLFKQLSLLGMSIGSFTVILSLSFLLGSVKWKGLDVCLLFSIVKIVIFLLSTMHCIMKYGCSSHII